MSFLIVRCGTFIPSRTVSLNAWTSRKAKQTLSRARPQRSPITRRPSSHPPESKLLALAHQEDSTPPLTMADKHELAMQAVIFALLGWPAADLAVVIGLLISGTTHASM